MAAISLDFFGFRTRTFLISLLENQYLGAPDTIGKNTPSARETS
jgi:hypothetical protein